MKPLAALLLCAGILSACSTASPGTPAPPAGSAVARENSPAAAPEATPVPLQLAPPARCLSIQDGDRHMEYAAGSLFLSTDDQPPKELELDGGLDVACTRLEPLKNSRQPALLIEFNTREITGVWDHKLAIAAVKTAMWILEPTTLVKHISETDSEEPNVALWSRDQDGKPVLTITNIDTRVSRKVRP